MGGKKNKKLVFKMQVFNFCIFVAHYPSSYFSFLIGLDFIASIDSYYRKKKNRSHETDIKYALGFGDRYIFIRLGEYEFLHQKELHSSCLPCSSFLVCYCKRVKTYI